MRFNRFEPAVSREMVGDTPYHQPSEIGHQQFGSYGCGIVYSELIVQAHFENNEHAPT